MEASFDLELHKKDQVFFSAMAYPYWLTFRASEKPLIRCEIWTSSNVQPTLHPISNCCRKAILLTGRIEETGEKAAVCSGCLTFHPHLIALMELAETHRNGGPLGPFLVVLLESLGKDLFEATMAASQLDQFLREDYAEYHRSAKSNRYFFQESYWKEKAKVWNKDINEILKG